MRIYYIVFLFLFVFASCEPKDEEEPLVYYKFDVSIIPEMGGSVEVYDDSNNTIIEDFDSLLEGTKVRLKAIPNEGYSFSGFSGNDMPIPEEEPTIIVMRDNAIAASFRSSNGTPVDVYGQLGVNGANIVDANGGIVQLRGMSFFWSQWMGKYWNANVVETLATDWEATIVRASMAVDADGGYIYNRTEANKVKTVVDAAIEMGIYVLIDWHSHHAEDYTNDAVAFFTQMAQQYGEYPNVIYEIYNEPLDVSWSNTIKPYAEEVIAAIRKEDADNLIIVGTPKWSQNVDDVIGNTINDDNIAYSLHIYASEYSHYINLFDKARSAIDAGIPLFVTEWGVSEASGNGNFNKSWTKEWVDFMDENKLSWCNWSLADKDETSAALQPGASIDGSWDSSELTESGSYIKDLLMKYQGYSVPQ